VFLLDEVDKMSTDFRGDPSSALLEVLDPEQNSAFNDHYLDVDYDLRRSCSSRRPTRSNGFRVLFRTDGDHPDRRVHRARKLNIAKRYLVKKQREANGLAESNIEFTDSALLSIIRHYTKEAGVRNLEREVASVCRKARGPRVVKKDRSAKVKVTPKILIKLLGPPRYRYGKADDEQKVGVATVLHGPISAASSWEPRSR